MRQKLLPLFAVLSLCATLARAAEPAEQKSDRAALEKKFIDMLSGATLTGNYTVGAAPLTLSANTCVLLGGTIQINSSTAASAAS